MTETKKNKDTLIYEDEGGQIHQKQKLVMNINNVPEIIELVDRFNLYVIRSKKHKSKSDAIAYLLKMALDKVDAEEKRAAGIAEGFVRAAAAAAAAETKKSKNKKNNNIASME